MDGAMNTPDVAYLLSVAAGAIVMLLVLIMRFKVHAFVALTLVSMLTALATGVTYDQVIPTMLTGFGGTLASVALLVGLGAIILMRKGTPSDVGGRGISPGRQPRWF